MKKHKPKQPWTDQELNCIRESAKNLSSEAIAEELGITVNNLYKVCHRNCITLPRSAEYNILEKLTEESAVKLLKQLGYVVAKVA